MACVCEYWQHSPKRGNVGVQSIIVGWLGHLEAQILVKMDNIKKDVSLYDVALNANWPSTEDKAFDELVFDLASQPPQDSTEQEEKLPTADDCNNT